MKVSGEHTHRKSLVILADWSGNIVGILENRQYTDCAINFKSSTVSYKVHKVIHNPTEEYQIVLNMQEPIVSEEQRLRVQ